MTVTSCDKIRSEVCTRSGQRSEPEMRSGQQSENSMRSGHKVDLVNEEESLR